MKSSQKVLVLSKKAVSLLKRKDRDPFVDAGGRVNHKIKNSLVPLSRAALPRGAREIFFTYFGKKSEGVDTDRPYKLNLTESLALAQKGRNPQRGTDEYQ